MSRRLVPLSGRHVRDLAALAGDDTITPWTATLTVSPGQSAWSSITRPRAWSRSSAFRFIGLEPALEHPESVGETIRRYEMTRDEWLER